MTRTVTFRTPFPLAAHGWVNGNVYLRKSAIRQRLDECAPGWRSGSVRLIAADGDTIVMALTITIGEQSHEGVGTGIVQRGTLEQKTGEFKPFDPYKVAQNVAKAYKTAASDAFARAALEFGVGEYLRDLPRGLNQQAFADWLAKLSAPPAPPAPATLNYAGAKKLADWASERAISIEDVLDALEVARLGEYAGTVESAKQAVISKYKLPDFVQSPQDLMAPIALTAGMIIWQTDSLGLYRVLRVERNLDDKTVMVWTEALSDGHTYSLPLPSYKRIPVRLPEPAAEAVGK